MTARRVLPLWMAGFFLVVGGMQVSFAAGGATFVVNSTGDAGDSDPADGVCRTGGTLPGGAPVCTLRAAIQQAARDAAKDVIHFGIPLTDAGWVAATDTFNIRPRTPLRITTPVEIDGFTQAGASRNTLADGNNAVVKIELDGLFMAEESPYQYLSATGLYVATTGAEIRGLAINRFPRAQIMLNRGGGHIIEGNFVGTDVTGTEARPGKWYGIEIYNSKNSLIGGTTPAARNVISGNKQAGVVIGGVDAGGSNENAVRGNFIGTDRTGGNALPNLGSGVLVSTRVGDSSYASGNTVGGGEPGAGNVISGNGRAGVEIYGGTLNRVMGNYIGTDALGGCALNDNEECPVGNGRNGVVLVTAEATFNTIGGVKVGQGNVISGNGDNGVEIIGPATGNKVMGNNIGTNKDADEAVPNGRSGISIKGAPDNTIGGPAPADNVISGNLRDGITIEGEKAVGNAILSNLIGIDTISTRALPNGRHGIFIEGASSTLMRGESLDDALVVSGNSEDGVHITGETATGNKLVHALIGTSFDGLRAMPNGNGVTIGGGAHENVIGETSEGLQNVISGNGRVGVVIFGANNTVRGNYIGTDRSGAQPVKNLIGMGIHGNDNVIEGNVISANDTAGIEVVLARGNRIQNNLVGTNKEGTCALDGDGVCPLGNREHGIALELADNNIIGNGRDETGVDLGNTIAFNGFRSFRGRTGHGISISGNSKFPSVGNTISHNSIFGNAGRGIDLKKPDGAEYKFGVNDHLDADEGPNHLMNYPVVTGISPAGSDLRIAWTVYAEPKTQYWFELFSNDELDPSGFGEGKRYVSGFNVFTDERGIASFATTVNPAVVTLPSATLAGPDGSTSEFSMIDSDGDALADAWERKDSGGRGGIDVNEDGMIDLDLTAKGANAFQKDLFVEWDAMEDIHPTDPVPSPRALELVTDAFAAAPAKNAPETPDGIGLHLEDGGDVLPNTNWTDLDSAGWPRELDRTKDGSLTDHSDGTFGHPDERESENWPRIRAARKLAYHHVIFADTVAEAAGRGEIANGLGGNDIFIAMGEWSTPGGTEEDQASVLMHELGHNLGLGHGGTDADGRADHTNNKPNYHSIMNYLWELHLPWMDENLGCDNSGTCLSEDKNGDGDTGDVAWSMTFSERAFDDLDEGRLDETAGIGGHTGHWVLSGPLPARRVLESGPVDWNRDGDKTDTGVEEPELNRIAASDDTTGREVLVGREDWSILRFYFVAAPTNAPTAHSALPEEVSAADEIELRSLGEGPGFFELSHDFYDALETDGVATVRVTRAGGTDGEVTVRYATSDGTATAGSDYEAVSGTLTFGDGEYVKSFEVPIVADPSVEPAETVNLTLSNATGGAIVGRRNTAPLTIRDNVNPGTFGFAEATPTGTEGGTLEVVIERTGGSTGEAAVTLKTYDMSARAGSDYAATNETVVFADGQTSATVDIALTDDAVTEPTESFYLELSNPTNGAALGPAPLIRANIADDAGPVGTLVVTSTLNTGAGSLRQAILDANARPGHDLIRFDIPGGGVKTIPVGTALPAITDPVTIDGYTQPGASPNTLADGSNAVLLIELRGSQGYSEAVLRVSNGPSIIRGLVINGFANQAIMLTDGTGSLVEGNFIGTDPSGTVSKDPRTVTPSSAALFTGAGTVVGGPAPASRNVVSGNKGTALTVGLLAVVQGNYIGTAADGITPLPNLGNGVEASGRPLIGGRLAVEGNRIAFNGMSGVADIGNGSTFVLSNSIHSNNPDGRAAFRGIAHALSPATVQNNLGDADFWTNYPVVSSAVNAGGKGRVAGRISSRPATALLIQLFSSPVVDPSGHGQGKTYLGSTTVTTDAGGNADFVVTLDAPLTSGEFVTATATDFSRTTSEFSARLPVGSSLTEDVYVVNSTEDSDDGFCDDTQCTLREAIHAANNHPGRDRIIFDISPGGVQTIAPGPAALPRLAEPVVIDGRTQPGYDGEPIIEISGQNVNRDTAETISGFRVVAGNTEIRGLVINRFLDRAIILGGGGAPFGLGVLAKYELPGGNVILNNYVGTDVSGTVARGTTGIVIECSSDNVIGGDAAEERNVVSGNIRGVFVTGFPETQRNNVIAGNFIGTTASGTAAIGDLAPGWQVSGVEINPGTSTVIRNNVIAAHGTGIFLGQPVSGDPVRITGNRIGTDVTGTVAIGNTAQGISIFPSTGTVPIVIGGSLPSERNIISGNGHGFSGGTGIFFQGAAAPNDIVVRGNYIGTDSSGAGAIPNRAGIKLVGARNVVEDNVISGNTTYGLQLYGQFAFNALGAFTGPTADHNTIARNMIGVGADGGTPVGNGGNGIELRRFATDQTRTNLGVFDNVIGGADASRGNVIAHNGGNGISAALYTLRNSFLSNSIFANGALGIELANNAAGDNDGPTPNDVTDSDTGPNNLQNFPVIVSARTGAGMTTVHAAFRGAAKAALTFQFFSDAGDPSGSGEGRIFLGSTPATTDAGGLASLVVTFAGELAPGNVVTATATDTTGNTSEFSKAATAVAQAPGQETASQALIGTVAPAPVVPTADPGGPYVADEGDDVILSGAGSFAPFDTITRYDWDLDADGQFDDATGLTTTVPYADDGIFTVGLKITTSSGRTSTATTVVMVENVAPRVDAGPDQRINKGETFSSTGSFADPGADEWTATVDYGDGTGVQPLPLTADKKFALGHVYASRGTFTVVVAVNDDDEGVGTDTVLVVVESNQPPELAPIGDRTLDEGDTREVTASATDPDGDAVTLAASGLPSFAGFTDNRDGTGTLRLAPGFADAGAYSVTVTASDGELADSETFTITVRNVNRPPDLAPIGERTVDEGDTVRVAVSATDPDGDSVTLAASGLPSFASFTDNRDGTGTLRLAPGFSDAGAYSMTVTASDGELADAETFTITVRNVNRPPTAEAGGPYVAAEGSSVTLDASGSSDPDGDGLTYQWELDGKTFAGVTVEISKSDDFDGVATLTVRDGQGGTATDAAAVKFNNVAPVVDAGADTAVTEGEQFSRVGNFVDPGADLWTATVDYGDGSGIQSLALEPEKTFRLGHLYAAAGTYTVTVVVRDDDGGTGTDTVTVTVTPGSGAFNEPRSKGYWKNHQPHLARMLALGPVELGDRRVTTVKGALEVFAAASTVDASDMLRAQLLAAMLNLRDRSDPMATGSDIRPVVKEARTFLQTHAGARVTARHPDRAKAIRLKDLLDAYNNAGNK